MKKLLLYFLLMLASFSGSAQFSIPVYKQRVKDSITNRTGNQGSITVVNLGTRLKELADIVGTLEANCIDAMLATYKQRVDDSVTNRVTFNSVNPRNIGTRINELADIVAIARDSCSSGSGTIDSSIFAYIDSAIASINAASYNFIYPLYNDGGNIQVYYAGPHSNGAIDSNDYEYFAGKLDVEVDADTLNELQVLSISNDTIFLSDGGFVKLPPAGMPFDTTGLWLAANTVFDPSSTNELQVLSISNDTIFLTSGGYVKLPPYLLAEQDGSTTNELQVISISNDTIFLTNGGFVVLPEALFVEQDSSITNELQDLVIPDPDSIGITNGNTIPVPWISVEGDGSPTNELQILSISNDTIFLSDGGFVVLPPEVDGSTTNEIQVLSISNDTIYLSNGGYAVLPAEVDGSITNEIQVLSISNDTIYLNNGGGFVKIPCVCAGGGEPGGGTVTSVGLSMPGIFNVANTPVNSAGTLTVTLVSQAQNRVWASPTGGSGTPGFRALIPADIPALPYVDDADSNINGGFASYYHLVQNYQPIGNYLIDLSGLTTDDLTEGSSNLYWTLARFNTAFASKTTDNLTEGSTNKYWSNSLFDTRFGTKTTDDLTEGTKKFFSNALARSAISVGGNLSYNSGTGVISYTTPPAADGSETIITEGTDIDITGDGTSGNPYVITYAGSGGGSPAWSSITGVPTNISELAALSFSANDIPQYVGGVLTKRTPAQVKASMSLTSTDVGLGNVPNVDATNAANISSGTIPAARIAGTATNGYVATLVGGVPTWQAASGGGGTQVYRVEKLANYSVNGAGSNATLIFTTASGGNNFIVTGVRYKVASKTGSGSSASLSIGTNATSYNNVASSLSVNSSDAVGESRVGTVNAPFATIAPSTGVYVRINTNSTLTTHTVNILVEGYYEP